MKTCSAKSKGRRACQEVREALLKVSSKHGITEDDIRVTSSGATGVDILFSPLAAKVFPFAIEVKNQERIKIWEAIEQSESHAGGSCLRIPLLIFRRNKSKLKIAMDFEAFLKLLCGETQTT